MKSAPWLGALLALGLTTSTVPAAGLGGRLQLLPVRQQLHGQIVDFTHNHGADRRIWSPALGQCRDLYVYLPPGFDPQRRYPLYLWLHSFNQDEKAFLQTGLAAYFDQAIASGCLPPFIIAAPDASITGNPGLTGPGSFFVNSQAGAFEDYIVTDVWNFLVEQFPVRPEREAHGLMGASMGGFGAYNLSLKHRDQFKVVVGLFPPLNLRWVNCRDHYYRNFNPCCWNWRTKLRPHEVIGRFYLVIPVRLKFMTDPIYGRGPGVIEQMAQENPIELLDFTNIQPGELDMYVGYAGKDQFNLDAQIESFLCVARQRGLCVDIGYEPRGRHDLATERKLLPGVVQWLAPRLTPFHPMNTLDK